MQMDRGKNISELIYKYIAANKSFDFISRVIPEMTIAQYTKALGVYQRSFKKIHLGNKSEQYFQNECDMGKLPVYLPQELKGWEKKEFLSQENVTFFPLFAYED